MGLISTVQKIVNQTSKIVNGSKNFGINIPMGKVGGALFGTENIRLDNLSDVASFAKEAASTVVLGYNIAKCAFSSLEEWGQILSNITGSLALVAMDIAQAIITPIKAQIKVAVQQVFGSIINIIMSFINLWASILSICEAISSLYDSWMNIGSIKIDTSFEAQNCSDLLSSIAACYLDKFLGKYIDDFIDKATEKINELGNDMNNFISEQLEDVNVLADYTNREAFLLKKASLQIKGLTPENILSL